MIADWTMLAANPIWPDALRLGTLIHIVIFATVALHCLINPRESRSTIIWLFAVWGFPIVGALLYAAFGNSRTPRKAWKKERSERRFAHARSQREGETQPLAYWRSLMAAHIDQPDSAQTFNRVLDRITPDHPLLGGNAVDLLLDGTETYPALLEAIEEAQHHIHLLYYIIGHDELARKILDACADRARAGVKVRILFDEFGSAKASLSRMFHRYRRVPNMRIVGFTQVNILKQRIQVNLRNHRKIAVIDGIVSFTGGINLHNGHLPSEGKLAIRDYHFRIRGPLVNELQYTFLRDWFFMTGENPEELLSETYFGCCEAVGNISARVVNSGPSTPGHSLEDLFFNALSQAQHQVVAVTPYLVLPPTLIQAMRMTAMRGVSVRLAVPANNNHRLVKYASRAQYTALLSAGVRIFERRGPLLHAKAMVIDESLSIFGSANLDVRSLRLNYETNVVSYDPDLTNRLMAEMLIDLAESDEIELNIWSKRPRRQRLLENLFALFSPIL